MIKEIKNGVRGMAVDPKYQRFIRGIEQWLDNKSAVANLRWRPWDGGEFRLFDPQVFAMTEIPGSLGPAGALSPDLFRPGIFQFSPFPKNVFERVEAAYARIDASYPRAVWNPYDGVWRNAVSRKANDPKTGPKGPHSELVRKINELKALHGQGHITDEQLQQRVLELLREYT